jgi:hypothetical protein
MSHIQLETAVQQEVVLAVLTHLQTGEINEATEYFAESCHFNDYEIGLEFTESRRLMSAGAKLCHNAPRERSAAAE